MDHKMIPAILVLSCFVHTATAEMTGNDFLKFCGMPQGPVVVCTALVTGLVTGFNSGYGHGMQGAITGLKGEAWAEENQEFLGKLFSAGRICLDGKITPDQASATVTKFFRDHEEFGDKQVADGVPVIFRDYRCDRE